MSYTEHFEQLKENWGGDMFNDPFGRAQVRDTVFARDKDARRLKQRDYNIGAKRQREVHLVLPLDDELLKVHILSGIIAVQPDKKSTLSTNTNLDFAHVEPWIQSDPLVIAYNSLRWRVPDDEETPTYTAAVTTSFTPRLLQKYDNDALRYQSEPKRGSGVDKLATSLRLPVGIHTDKQQTHDELISRIETPASEIPDYVGQLFTPLGNAATTGFMTSEMLGAHVDWVLSNKWG